MDANEFCSPEWCHALTLDERVGLLRQRADAEAPLNETAARRRADHWRLQPPFPEPPYFARRLAAVGLTDAQFVAILGTPAESIGCALPERPVWLDALSQAFCVTPDGRTADEQLSPDLAVASFAQPCEPLVRNFSARLGDHLRRLVERSGAAPFVESTVSRLCRDVLVERLAGMTARTLTLELNVARVTGLLDGETPEDRFRDFFQALKPPACARGLLREYPVLGRQLSVAAGRWLAFSVEVLERLCADWSDITSMLAGGRDPGLLVSWRSGGDDHCGRHVVVLGFDSGFHVVYKPRPQALACHFQDLLAWLNARGQTPQFRTLEIIDRGSYGWVEFVDAAPCRERSQIRRFYERQGSNLALLYVLNATDFHHENLIAAGEHPVLIDVETLFHQSPDSAPETVIDAAFQSMIASVHGVGLLPHRAGTTEEADGLDLSGLGAAERQVTPFAVPQIDGVGTDTMRWVRRRATVESESNCPTLQGAAVDVRAYARWIEAGFAATYRVLVRHREALLSPDGPVARCAADEVRILLRPTQTYGVLLRESFHPDLLRDALDRDRLFDRLWMSVRQRPYLGQVVAAECRDLAEGDIPIFFTSPASRDLWTSHGERIMDFLPETGLDVVRRRLAACGDEDLERQLWFIRASFASIHTDTAGRPRRGRAARSATRAEPDRLLRQARAVGDRLAALAVRFDDQVTWIGLTLDPQRRWSIAPLGLALYDGLPGVVLFLAYLGEMTADATYTALARAGVACLRRCIEQQRAVMKDIGGFTGWGGVIYVLSSLGILWNESSLHEDAARLVEVVEPLVERDQQFDVMSGAAGCLATILSFHRAAPSRQALAVAVPFQHIGILSLEFHVDKLSRPLL